MRVHRGVAHGAAEDVGALVVLDVRAAHGVLPTRREAEVDEVEALLVRRARLAEQEVLLV